MTTKLGEIEIALYASVETGEPQHIGTVAAPVAAGRVERTEHGVSMPVNVDRTELLARLRAFADELAENIHQNLTGN